MFEWPEIHIPIMDETQQQIRGFSYETGLNLNMGYMTLPLDVATWKILRVIMPLGLFKCFVLPQGIKPATDIFQALMIALFLPMCKKVSTCYLDEFLHKRAKTFKKHIKIVDKILQWMKDSKLQVNGGKSK